MLLLFWFVKFYFTFKVENEYGSYGCDHEYMYKLEVIFRKYLGENVVLFTTDGAGDSYLKCGTIGSLYATVDFGPTTNPKIYFDIQRKYQPKGPLVRTQALSPHNLVLD